MPLPLPTSISSGARLANSAVCVPRNRHLLHAVQVPGKIEQGINFSERRLRHGC